MGKKKEKEKRPDSTFAISSYGLRSDHILKDISVWAVFAKEQGACSLSSIPTQGKAYSHGIIFQKISLTEKAACWLPSAFWGNSKRMFQMPRFYKIHVISCRAWLADKNRLVNKPTGNLDGSCQRYCRVSVALGLLSVSVLDTYTRHWEPLVSCLAGFTLGA